MQDLREHAYKDQKNQWSKLNIGNQPQTTQYMISDNKKQAGLLKKKNERREAEEKAYLLANPLAEPTTNEFEKTATELQTEAEQHRAWIRNRNCQLYDYKVKQLIQNTTNGSELLKQEVEESDNRLQAIKAGASLDKVAPKHVRDYYLTAKDPYFMGAERIMRNIEREWFYEKKQEATNVDDTIQNKAYETVDHEDESMPNAAGGFFITDVKPDDDPSF